jgi:hypothetical protein
MRKLQRVQPDLFVTSARRADLSGIDREKAVALLRAMLTEAVNLPGAEPRPASKKELGDE